MKIRWKKICLQWKCFKNNIKIYQCTTIPFALYGVFVYKNGEKIEVNIGEDNKDLVFVIPDLLPHIA